MRALILTASLAVVILGGVSVVAWITLRDAQEYTEDYQRDLKALRRDFDALDAKYPVPSPGPLTGPRLELYVAVRQAVAEKYLGREKDHGKDTHRNPRTHVEVLTTLRIELEQAKMTAKEYEAVEERVFVVLAAGNQRFFDDPGTDTPETNGLYGLWVAQLAAGGDLRARDPVKNVPPEETELVADRVRKLQESLPGLWGSIFLRELIRNS